MSLTDVYKPTMHRALTTVLQGVTALIGIGAGIFLLVEPHFEGRNVDVAQMFKIGLLQHYILMK